MPVVLQDQDVPQWRCKVMLIGDTGVGKSSLVLRYAEDVFEPGYVTTIGVDFRVRKFRHKFNGKEMETCVQIWDTAGQERFAPLIRTYYRSSTACMVVFDLTSRETFENVRTWMCQLLEATCGDLDRSCIFVIGNKCDDTAGREVDSEEAQELAEQFGIQYRECSAKNDTGVNTIFEEMVAAAREIHCTGAEFGGLGIKDTTVLRDTSNDDDSVCYCSIQ